MFKYVIEEFVIICLSWPVGLSPWKHGFILKAIHVRFILDKASLGQVAFQVILFALVSNIPQLLNALIIVAWLC
jgi:hypothetical protein